ncbi:SigE family RNA polymerase sigma factor [Dactylosporangium cerinum]|uniref:SigE family RNA polymerase sigma factor n=1 Tax=Dactylosporangium cerinum TaxID=1434730 RepID=A0ABV9WAF8_9ACTN
MVTVHDDPRTADDRPPRHVSFAAFYAASFQAVTIQLFAYTNDLDAAQDVAQEAFYRALVRWEKISAYQDPVSWVRQVAWNLATSRWRKARSAARFARRHREEHVPGPDPDRVALARALATLPQRQRRILILFYLADLSVRDIAEQEGIPEGTVKTWLHRGRLALAGQLAEEPQDV